MITSQYAENVLVIIRQDYGILQHVPAYEHLSEVSQNLRLGEPVGVGVGVVGVASQKVPFIYVE